jgi:hypothetical protein
MALVQLDQDLAVVGDNGGAVGKGHVVHSLRQEDIVHYQPEIAGRNLPADVIFDGMEDLLDAGSRRGADMELDQPAIDLGEEIGAN